MNFLYELRRKINSKIWKPVYCVLRNNNGYKRDAIHGYNKILSIFGKVYVKEIGTSFVWCITHPESGFYVFDMKDVFYNLEDAKKHCN